MNVVTSATIRTVLQVGGMGLVLFGHTDQQHADAYVDFGVQAVGALATVAGVVATAVVAVRRQGWLTALTSMLGVKDELPANHSEALLEKVAERINDPAATAIVDPKP